MNWFTEQLQQHGELARGTDLGGVLQATALHIEHQEAALDYVREENAALVQRVQEQDDALRALADVFFHAAKFARHEITMDEFGDGMKDQSMFRNIMAAAYGRDSLGAPLPPKKVRKKKEVAA